MAFLTEAEARAVGESVAHARRKTASEALLETASVSSAASRFDIFLSHSALDAKVILGVKTILERMGNTVYVDWIHDKQLDREKVSPDTAAMLRRRMDQSKSLFYAHSINATKSRWMPWELGYFDGSNGNVAILPVVANAGAKFKGEEYVGLYPYVDITGRTTGSVGNLWIHREESKYKHYREWVDSIDKLRPAV